MRRALRKAMTAWLRLESAGHERPAEEALFRLLGLLPRPAPSPGFVETVLRRAGVGGAAAAPGASWRMRWATALALVMGGAGVVFLPPLLAPLLPPLTAGRLADLAAGLVVGLLGGLPEGVAVWRGVTGLGRAFAVAFQSPAMMAALLTSALLSLGALGALRGLMISERSSRHVGTL